jgi:hypothetical protein
LLLVKLSRRADLLATSRDRILNVDRYQSIPLPFLEIAPIGDRDYVTAQFSRLERDR